MPIFEKSDFTNGLLNCPKTTEYGAFDMLGIHHSVSVVHQVLI